MLVISHISKHPFTQALKCLNQLMVSLVSHKVYTNFPPRSHTAHVKFPVQIAWHRIMISQLKLSCLYDFELITGGTCVVVVIEQIIITCSAAIILIIVALQVFVHY